MSTSRSKSTTSKKRVSRNARFVPPKKETVTLSLETCVCERCGTHKRLEFHHKAWTGLGPRAGCLPHGSKIIEEEIKRTSSGSSAGGATRKSGTRAG